MTLSKRLSPINDDSIAYSYSSAASSNDDDSEIVRSVELIETPIATTAGANSKRDAATEDDVEDEEMIARRQLSLWRVFVLFLGFGVRAWGGPVVQIDMMRSYFVDDAKWVTRTRFNRVLAVYQVLPGPEATELACYFGMLARGRLGSVAGGLGFVLPGLLLMLLLSWLYDAFYRNALAMGDNDAIRVRASFSGIQACVTAMVVRAVHRLGTQALVHADTKALSPILLLSAFMAAIASVLGINFFIPLGVGGIVNTIWEAGGEKRALLRHVVALVLLAVSVVAFALYRVYAGDGSAAVLTATGIANTNPPEYWALFVVGLIAGLVTFGGAFTTIPFVRAETSVWLLPSVFLDSIGLAQCLPTPLVMFVCFVGFMGRGIGGALLMTLGIFLPAFSFTLIGHNFFERLVKLNAIRFFLDGVTAAVIGLVGFTALELLRDTVAIQMGTIVIFVVSIGTLYNIVSIWTAPSVLVGAAIAGQVLLLPPPLPMTVG